MSPTETSFLHTLQVTLSLPSSVIVNWYLETKVDKSPSSFEIFFRNDTMFLAANGYSNEVCDVVNGCETEAVQSEMATSVSEAELDELQTSSDKPTVESEMATSGLEAELDESQTSSDKPAGTKESEMVCAESQPCSNKPETAPFDSMTAGDKSGAGVEELEVT